jgi:hypothetical protein
MAAPKSKTGNFDEFANIIYQNITESAANTLTFQQIQTGYGTLDKKGWIVSRIEWYVPLASVNLLGTSADLIQIALVTSNLITTLSLADASLIDLLELGLLQATAVGQNPFFKPLIRDFSSLPGGGRLMLPYPLYIGVKGTDLTAAINAAARIFFTERDLGDQEWMELVQQTRLLV